MRGEHQPSATTNMKSCHEELSALSTINALTNNPFMPMSSALRSLRFPEADIRGLSVQPLLIPHLIPYHVHLTPSILE